MSRARSCVGVFALASACEFGTAGQGQSDAAGSGGEASTGQGGSTQASAPDGGDGVDDGADDDASPTTSSPASSTAGDTTAGSSPTSSDDGRDDATTDDTGPPPAFAGEDALVVRYFIDEEGSGALATDLLDAGPDPKLDLEPFNDGRELPTWVEENGNRGLHWPRPGSPGRAQASLDSSKLVALDGTSELTIELVTQVTGAFQTVEPWARILVWQPDVVPYNIQLGVLAAVEDDAFALDLRASWQTDNSPQIGRWPIGDGRVVAHLVIDTSADQDERVQMFVDGELVAPTISNPPGQGETFVVTDAAYLVLGNRPSSDTSFGGTLFYAAIYDRAFDAGEVQQNAALLAKSDDGP